MYALIIVDYNSLEKTIEYTGLCAAGLGREGASRVVIVENAEVANDLELLTAAFGPAEDQKLWPLERKVSVFHHGEQEIVYCVSGENLGYARGNNLGVRIADSLWDNDGFIISNNDLVFRAPLELSLVDRIFDEHPEVGVVGPLVVTPAGEQQSPRHWQGPFQRLFVNYWASAFGGLLGADFQKRFWDKHCNDTVADAPSGRCDWVSGCFFFARADAFRKAGMFDEHTFLYAEEMILAKRLEKIGCGEYFCREVEVIHKHGETTKKTIPSLRNHQIDFEANSYFYRNYMGTSKFTMACAGASFRLFSWLFNLKQKLRSKG